MAESISLDEIREIHDQGFNCAQIVFAYGAEKMGLDRETALKIAGPFGGGMYNGETCGCVTGALMALGLKYSQHTPFDLESKKRAIAKKGEFETKFRQDHGTLLCRDLLGLDFSKPEEKAQILQKGLLQSFCPGLMWAACSYLDEML